ncbi:MAG: ABC transporter permease [Candidatus Woesearchaeota archaeon]
MYKKVLNFAFITFKGGLRTKLFITVLVLSMIAFLLFIPAFSSLSMRQVREVATSLCLSLISFVSIVLTIFLGINLIYKDLENKIVYFALSQPVSRDIYIIGKYIGLSLIIVVSILILSLSSVICLMIADKLYEADLTIRWFNYFVAIVMESIKTLILGSFVLFFTSFSTNIFLPIFGSIGIYIIGTVIQTVYDYINSIYGKELPYITILISKFAYFILPNLSLYDYKFIAVYNLNISYNILLWSITYGFLYILIMLSIAALIFRKRELL